MRKSMKAKIIAFICTLAVLVTTVSGTNVTATTSNAKTNDERGLYPHLFIQWEADW